MGCRMAMDSYTNLIRKLDGRTYNFKDKEEETCGNTG